MVVDESGVFNKHDRAGARPTGLRAGSSRSVAVPGYPTTKKQTKKEEIYTKINLTS